MTPRNAETDNQPLKIDCVGTTMKEREQFQA